MKTVGQFAGRVRSAGCTVAGVLMCLLPTIASAQPPITALAFARDGEALVAGSQLGIRVRAWPSLKHHRDLETALPQIHDLVFSPRGDRLLVGGGAAGQYGGFEMFSWPDGRLLHEELDHQDVVYAVSWADDNSEFATASGDEHVATWHTVTASPKLMLTGHSRLVLAACYIPGTELLVSAGADQSLRVWNRASGDLVRTLDNHTDVVRDLAVRPVRDGLSMIASAGADRTVRFWQPTIGRLIRFARLPAEPLSLAWTDDAARVIVGCSDGHVRMIDPDTVEILTDQAVVDGWAYAVAVAPDGSEIAVGGTGGRIIRAKLDVKLPKP